MAVDAYMYFMDYNGKYLPSESQVVINSDNVKLWDAYKFKEALSQTDPGPGLFEVEDYSFDIEQTLNIGSQSTGAGAGKVTFNPFSITRKIDCSSSRLFMAACSGTPFKQVALALRKSSGQGGIAGASTGQAGSTFCVFLFKLVAVKTISWAHDDESPKETTTFEYGGLQVHYCQQKPNGEFLAEVPGGWNRVKNVADIAMTPEIT